MERKHGCDAVVVACIDYRFQDFLHQWTEEKLKDGYDYIGFAGSTKDLDTIMEQIGISVRLHHINNAHLIHHEECGAYGAESTLERHAEELRKAKEEILKKHPNLSVSLYYLHLDGTFESIE